jgi:sirohydrochlorin cobaltochelatase
MLLIPMAASAEAEAVQKRAILLAAFGTSDPTGRASLEKVDRRAREVFPGMEIRWAYTSGRVRAKLAGQGILLDSPEMALAKLMSDGYTEVALLPLHVIPGREFHDVSRNSRLFEGMAGGIRKMAVGLPLLSSRDDMQRVAKALLKDFAEDRKKVDAVLFMGHGTGSHPSDAVYLAMHQVLNSLDPGAHLATVDGFRGLDAVIPVLKDNKAGKVLLVPFMLVAGDHARNDMAGDEPDSWKSILKEQGIEANAILKGLGENPEVMDIWLDHLKTALSELNAR